MEKMDFMLRMGEFDRKIAYIVPSPKPPVEDSDDEEVEEEVPINLDACKEGLHWMGFESDQINVFLADEEEDPPEPIEKDETDKILLFIYYKGPPNVANGFIHCGEILPLEEYARQSAENTCVKVVILFDTCRRLRGYSGAEKEVTLEGDPQDIVFVYR